MSRTEELFNPVIHALYDSSEPLTVDQIAKAVKAENREISELTSTLLNQSNGFSPIRRIKNDSYTVTAWARKELDDWIEPHEYEFEDPRYTNTSDMTNLPVGKQSGAVVAMVQTLKSDPDGIQKTTSLMEMLHILADENYHLIGNVEPQALLPYLYEALEQLDKSGDAPLFLWGTVDDEPELFATYEGGVMSSSKTAIMTHAERLNQLIEQMSEGIFYEPFPGHFKAVDVLSIHSSATSQLLVTTSEGSYRVHFGQRGETVTPELVNALADECPAGEKGCIMSLGRISQEAQLAADTRGIIIIPMNQTLRFFSVVESFSS